MHRSEISAEDVLLWIQRDIAAHHRGVVPELKRLMEPIEGMGRQKFRGVVVGTRVVCKLQEPVLIPVVLWLYLEAKLTGQLLVTLKELAYVLKVLVELRCSLREVSS